MIDVIRAKVPLNIKAKAQLFISTHIVLITLVLIITLAGVLRFYNLGEHSFWYDEAASAMNVRTISEWTPTNEWGPFTFAKRERVPPFYFLLSVPFYNISQSEWVLCLPSVIFGIASIPLIYLLGSQLLNKRIGLVAASLLALSPFHIYYSQEFRPYSLFLFLSLLAFCFATLVILKNKKIYFAGMIISIVLGIYTHTFMVFVFLLLDIYFVLGWKTNRHLLKSWLLSHLLIALLCIPEIYILLYHISRGNTNLINYPPGILSIVSTIYLFTVGRVFFPTGPNLIFLVVQFGVWGVGVVLGVRQLWRQKANPEGYRNLSFIISAILIFILIFTISMLFIPLFDEARVNYIIFLLPFYFLIVGIGWSSLANPLLRKTLIFTALFISLCANYPYFFQWDEIGKGDFRAAAEYIWNNSNGNAAIVYHTNNASALPLDFYLHWQVPQQLFKPEMIDLSKSDQLWLVVIKQIEGIQFGQMLFEGQKNKSLNQESSDIACNRAFVNPNYRLLNAKVFPGKNELSVCQFNRKTP